MRKELGLELEIKDLFLCPTIAKLADFIQDKEGDASLPPIEAEERPERIPLSFAQERLWFIDQFQGSTQYHICQVLNLKGDVDLTILEETLKQIVQRHEVLRTVIRTEKAITFQQILPVNQWMLERISVEDAEQYESQQELLDSLTSAPFNLSDDYMLRAQIIEQGTDSFKLVLTMHHIASDGWSMNLLIQEFAALYNARKEGELPPLQSLEVQYADYAIWQRKYLEGDQLSQQLDYWKTQLAQVRPLEMPLDYNRPLVQSTKGSTLSGIINADLAKALNDLANERKVTLFMLLLSAFKVLLHRYSGQADICVGTPIAGRTRQETEGLIGFFVNMLALRSQVSNEQRFVDLVEEIKATTLDAYACQDVPFEQIVEATTNSRDLSRSPIFEVTFSVNKTLSIDNNLQNNAFDVEFEAVEETTATYDLNLDLHEVEEGLMFTAQYCTDLYKEETIAQLLKHYEVLLESIVANPSVLVSDLNLISASERSILLGHEPTESGVWFNKGAVDLGNTETIEERFVRMVEQYGEEVAVIHGDNHWTFNQLEEYSNQVANELLSRGLSKQDLVGVYLDRSPELIGSLLGILKAGGVYVPLDRQNPMDRLEKMLGDGNFAHVISQQDQWKDLEGLEYDRVLYLESIEASTERPSVKNGLRDWAYMLYTSGSTGAPKGAITRHDGAMNHILAEYALLDLSDGFRFLQSAGIGSDISLFQMLAPILKGGASVIIDRYDVLDYETLIATIEEKEVSLVEFVPSYIRGLIDRIKERGHVPAFKALKGIMMVGEAVPVELVNEWRKLYPETRVVNGYGPCEASDDITQYEIKSELDERLARVPIGEPLQNLNIFICDEKGELKSNRRSRRDLCEWRRCRSWILGTGREDSRTLCSQSF